MRNLKATAICGLARPPLGNDPYNFKNSSSEDRKMLQLLLRATGIYSENQTASFSDKKRIWINQVKSGYQNFWDVMFS